MFHPVGSQPPSVYWRRRLVFIASLLVVAVLAVLTVNAMRASSDATQSAAVGKTLPPTTPAATGLTAGASSGRSSPAASTASPAGHRSSGTPAHRSGSGSGSGSVSGSSSAAPPAAACQAKNLAVQAVPAATSYHVGDKPVLQLQVTDVAATPCVQNLADSQVELRVYNGESRVWGSHDCRIQPGTELRTLAPGVAVRVAVDWSGLSSEPKCAGTRQRVGAGTYTLYALLGGRPGKAAQFSIS